MTKYKAALKVHDRACRAYKAALVKYRALNIDDEEFLAAKAVMVEANKVFDAAWLEQKKVFDAAFAIEAG